MKNMQNTTELDYREREIIRKALSRLRREIINSKEWLEAQNHVHKEMITLLDGNENNKLAKEKLKYTNDCLKDNKKHIKNLDMAINKIDILINKIAEAIKE